MRIGRFSRTGLDYGAATDVVKPANNDYGSIMPDALNDPTLKLTEAQKQELVQRINDLFNVYRGAREWYT